MEAVISALRSAISFDASCCTAVDPKTLLSIGAITDEPIERMHARLFELEYMDDDVNQYETLIKTKQTAAILSGALNGNLHKSKRYRMILEPAGFGDEMRAVLLSKGNAGAILHYGEKADGRHFIRRNAPSRFTCTGYRLSTCSDCDIKRQKRLVSHETC
ncbi:hypothetical protein QKW52_07215 [Bacillus sonorensis]|nr:hypothetical protein [Bacillus sonorensis]